MEKILFDTDIGNDIDDALALAYLLCEPRCDLVGITTESGQGGLRAAMASAICRNLGRGEVPIHVGIPCPALSEDKQPLAPQAARLGRWEHDRFTDEITAIDFMRRVIRGNPGEVTLVGVGPMTNIAALFLIDPEIPALLKGLVLMCGSFAGGGGGEWNARCDPYATAVVYGAVPGRPVPPSHISHGVDVTMRVGIGRDEALPRFRAFKALEPVADFAEVWFERCERAIFHDPLAVVSVFHPEVCRYGRGRVSVSLNAPTAGWTVFDRSSVVKPHVVAEDVDVAAFFNRYFSVFQGKDGD